MLGARDKGTSAPSRPRPGEGGTKATPRCVRARRRWTGLVTAEGRHRVARATDEAPAPAPSRSAGRRGARRASPRARHSRRAGFGTRSPRGLVMSTPFESYPGGGHAGPDTGGKGHRGHLHSSVRLPDRASVADPVRLLTRLPATPPSSRSCSAGHPNPSTSAAPGAPPPAPNAVPDRSRRWRLRDARLRPPPVVVRRTDVGDALYSTSCAPQSRSRMSCSQRPASGHAVGVRRWES